MEQQSVLSMDEKEEIINSLDFLADNVENLVVNFYDYFLDEQNVNLINQITNESLINMFSSSLSIIISQIENPFYIQEYIRILSLKYPNLISMMSDKELFQQSFMNALIDTLGENYTAHLGNLWQKAIVNYMSEIENYFKAVN